MKPHRAHWIYASVLLLLLPGCASLGLRNPDSYGRGWHPPYDSSGTLGDELEDRFATLLESCGVGHLDKETRSALPNILQQSLQRDLSREVITLNGESTWNLFRFVFSTADIDSFPSPNLRDYLDPSLLSQSALPQPAPGSRAILHRQTCGSVVNAAIKAKLKLPPASLSAALQSEFEDHTELALVQGRFFSPLAYMLSGEAPVGQRLRTLMAIWYWHRDQAARTSMMPPCYIAGFSGLAVFTLRRAGKTTDLALQASAGAPLPAVDLDVALQASGTERAATVVRDFATHVYLSSDRVRSMAPEISDSIEAASRQQLADCTSSSNPPPDAVQFLPLPRPEQIATQVLALEPKPLGTSVPSVDIDTPQDVTLQYALPGLPQRACNSAEWAPLADTTAKGETLDSRVTSLEMVVGADSACTVTVRYKPLTEYLRSGERNLQRFSLQSREGVSLASGTAHHLKLTFPARLNVNTSPQIEIAGTRVVEDPVNLVWRFDVLIDDQGKPLDWEALASSGVEVSLLCERSQLMTARFVEKNDRQKTATFEIVQGRREGRSQPGDCPYVVSLTMRLQDQKLATRSAYSVLRLPRPLAAGQSSAE